MQPSSAVTARVVVEHRGLYRVLAGDTEFDAIVPGKMQFDAESRADLPAVGDWVTVEPIDESQCVIRELSPRRSAFVRKVAGFSADSQIVAANVDVVFVVDQLDTGPNPRRIERYLTVAWESGAVPVVVLAKADLSLDVAAALELVAPSAPGVEVHAVSSVTGDGLDALRVHLGPDVTVAAMGPSGVGKSSLINALAEAEVMATKDVRWDGKGRHTTTHRELVVLPSGASIIDTPGMRELGLFEGDEGIDRTFSDIAAFAEQCRFRDCAHDREPGCAVRAALDSGELSAERYASYTKQLRELAAIARKKDRRLANEEAKKWKRLNKEGRARARMR